MAKIKSVVLNKSKIKNGYNVEFYNPFWGRFAIECIYDKDTDAFNNMIKLMRVGDYYLVNGKPNIGNPAIVREFNIIKYMAKETEDARKSKRELAIPNMSVREMNNLADDILADIKFYSLKSRTK